VVKEILQRRTQKIYDKDVVKTLLAEVIYIRDAG
jgi:hypothetical protein